MLQPALRASLSSSTETSLSCSELDARTGPAEAFVARREVNNRLGRFVRYNGPMSQPRQFYNLLIGMAVACGGQDHTFNKLVDPNPPESVASSLRVDLAIQENDWGSKVTRCQNDPLC